MSKPTLLTSDVLFEHRLTSYRLAAGVVTTAGTVVVRILMGQACDKFGPRYGQCLFSPALVQSSA